MAGRPQTNREPTSVALSQLFVAHLIEFDNAVEGWLPHRTSAFGDGGPPPPALRNGHPFRRPWLSSASTWQNLLRFIGDEGLPRTVAALSPADLTGPRRWGYVRLEDDRLVSTWAGRFAHGVWSHLEPAIEHRWRTRFGGDRVDGLRAALIPFAGAVTTRTPRSVPQLGFANGGRLRPPVELGAGEPLSPDRLDLGALLARVLTRLTIAYERESSYSAAIGFDVLEPLVEAGGELARPELIARSGVSAEAVTSFLGRLRTSGAVVERRIGRSIAFALTRVGADAVERHDAGAVAAEAALAEIAGREASDRLIAALAAVRDDVDGLRQTLEPPDGAWRSRPPYAARTAALLADPAGRLPRQPVVTHRGGFPDGA